VGETASGFLLIIFIQGAWTMTAKDILRQVVEFGHLVVRFYVSDLTDAELLVRSVPGSNHIAWQMGHLITATRHMLKSLGHSAPDLPAGFEEAYTPETSGSDDPVKFASKAEYLALAEQMKAASLEAIETTPENTLDQPGPESMREYAPTMASVLTILGNHWLMHSGQFVPIRRKLGKKPLF
jgi:hypothetical protein